MAMPKAYSPVSGQRYQILCRHCDNGLAWEHCDYATDCTERKYLIGQYRMAYGIEWEFKVITLPRKYWPVKVA